MSSILKALKKLELEKSGRFPDSLKIDSDILKPADSSRSTSPVAVTLLFLLVFGGGAAVAYFFLKDTSAPQATPKPQPVVTAKSIQPPVPPPEVKSETLPAEIVIVPARKEPPVNLPSYTRQQKPAAAGTVAAKAVNNIDKKSIEAPVSSISEKPKEATETAKRELPAAIVPTLRVNGIAFQNSSADSMAIVNGVPVSNGSTIEGATVEEVRKDRVLFQFNGKKLEIQLGQSNR